MLMRKFNTMLEGFNPLEKAPSACPVRCLLSNRVKAELEKRGKSFGKGSPHKKPKILRGLKPLSNFLMGFTLTEVLLAVVVLAVALCVLLLGFVTCAYLVESSRNLTRAITHAQYVMEEIKDTDFNEVKARIESGYWDWNTQSIEAQGLTALSNESIDTQVTGEALLDIVVEVSWQDRGGRERNTSLETLLAEP
jgi:prepilin-type N-terminal cleavage/methylation domain-containing protein